MYNVYRDIGGGVLYMWSGIPSVPGWMRRRDLPLAHSLTVGAAEGTSLVR